MYPLRNFILRSQLLSKNSHLTQAILLKLNIHSENHSETYRKSFYRKNSSKYYTLAAFCLASSCGVYLYFKDKKVFLSSKSENIEKSSSYPLYTLEEVSKHASKEDRIWVTYMDGVYDITNFVEDHPGGDIIMMAAGGAVDPFWMMYGVHKQPEILQMLESFRIGNISKEESAESIADMNDPYAYEPKRNRIFKINSQKPFNAEPPLPLLIQHFITPSDLFYVRNHLPVPVVDEKEYELEINGIGVLDKALSLEDLKTKFEKVSVTATIQCAGNRRSEMTKVKPVKGLNWEGGAIANAVWSGVRLYDVLKYCGLKDTSKIRHVQFEGLDTDPANVPYGASIPVEKLLNPYSDIILAYEMNGEPLTRDHGYPLRVIIPGVVGARNVKWLGKIILSDEESPSHWQQNDYKGFCPSVDWDTVDFKSSLAIQELPIISAICDPVEGQKVKLKNGKLIASGYAWSGGGCKVIRVDVTASKGKHWQPAEIVQQENANPGRCWSWVLWRAEIPVDQNIDEVEIWAKAVDSNYNTQPETFENIWNLRGVLANAYHRVKIFVNRN